ncbi:MAG: hypothetical protein F4Z17_04940 [Acidimicrobiia bacterium]|nr:hypothetical protein [Acidimicrobiia bacterium]
MADCPGCPEALQAEWFAEKYRDTLIPCAVCGRWWDFAPRQVHMARPATIPVATSTRPLFQTIGDILKSMDQDQRVLTLN